MVDVYLYGKLRQLLIDAHPDHSPVAPVRLTAQTPVEAIRALLAQIPGMRAVITRGEFHVTRDGAAGLLPELVSMRFGRDDELHIHPAAAGAGGLGAAAIISLVLAGAAVAYALTLSPEIGNYNDRDDVENRASYLFDGAVNSQSQGGPVPLIYGRMLVGSVMVSGGITSERLTGAPGGGGDGGGGGGGDFPDPPDDFPDLPDDFLDPPDDFLDDYDDYDGWYDGRPGRRLPPINFPLGRGGGGGGSSRPRTPIEGRNTLQTNATIRVVDLLGEGEILGLVNGAKSIYIDGTPVVSEDDTVNFDGISFEFRSGLPDQTPLLGIPYVENERAVNQQITYSESQVRTVQSSTVDSVRVTLRFPRLTSVNSQGDIHGATVRFRIEVQAAGGAYLPALYQTITDKNTAPAELSWLVQLPGQAPYNIRVTRLTADSDSDKLHNDLYWARLTEITSIQQSYPYSALVGITAEAEKFTGQINLREYDVYGRIIKVPSNYDPATRTYTGIWDGAFKRAWTDNGAWVVYDLLTEHRFGLGGEIADELLEATKWELYAIAQFNDVMVSDGQGGQEPRFQFNGAITAAAEAKRLLDHVLSNFNSALYYGGGAVVPVQDSPADATALISNANVIDGEFRYKDLPVSSRVSAVAVSFTDPADGYKQGIELVVDDALVSRYGYRQTDLAAMFCTSRSQAQRLGRHLLFTQEYESDVLEYSAGLEHASIRPGGVVRQSDENIAGVRAGFRVGATEIVSVFDPLAVESGAVVYLSRSSLILEARSGDLISPNNSLAPIEGHQFYIVRIYGVDVPASHVVFVNVDSRVRVTLTDEDNRAFAMRFFYDGEQVATAWLPLASLDDSYIWSVARYAALRPRQTFQADLFALGLVAGDTLEFDIALVRTDRGVNAANLTLVRDADHLLQVRADSLAGVNVNLQWTASIVMPDGSIEERSVVSVRNDTLYLDAPLSAAPLPAAMGVLSAAEVSPRTWRVLAVTERDNLEFGVTARLFHHLKYPAIEAAIHVAVGDYSLIPTGALAPPAAVRISEYLYHDGVVIKTAISIAVEEPAADPRATYIDYQIQGPDDDAYTPLTLSSSRSIDQRDARLGEYRARARYVAGTGALKSPWTTSPAYTVVGKVAPPSTPENLRVDVRPETGLVISIDPIPDIDRDDYSYFVGAVFEDAVLLARVKSTEYVWRTVTAGDLTFWVVAHDTSDAINGGSVPATITFTVTVPGIPDPTLTFAGDQMVLNWPAVVAGTFAVSTHVLRFDGALVVEVDGTRFAQRVDWQGCREFTLAARNIAGNLSEAARITVDPVSPGSPTVRTRVIDNTVLFNYEAAAGSLPIRAYEIRRGDVFSAASLRDSKSGNSTFTIITELAGGAYTYWWSAVDTAGNTSTPTSAAVVVTAPPDYTLLASYSAKEGGWPASYAPGGGVVTQDDQLLFSVVPGQTWAEHFSDNGFRSPQAQIDAGYPFFLQPTADAGSLSETIDYGSVIPTSLITLAISPEAVTGSITTTVTLEYSLDSIAWETTHARQVLASNFRYVRWSVAFAGADRDDLIRVNDVQITLDVKLVPDAGSAVADATDQAGTWVPFNKVFIDANQPQLTPGGNTPIFGVSDFQDEPYPTGFYAFLFNTDGDRVSGPFAWQTTGYLGYQ